MEIQNIIEIIVSVLSGLAVCIPLVFKLVQFVQANAKEKNWSNILKLVVSYMSQAESLYTEGVAKKAWVMGMVEQSAANINYDLTAENKQKISEMIDAMCDMAKVVNTQIEIGVDGE